MKRWRRWRRRRALRKLFPGLAPHFSDDAVEPLLVCIPVRSELLTYAEENFYERGRVSQYYARLAEIEVAKLIRERLPVKFPDTKNGWMKEWKHGPA